MLVYSAALRGECKPRCIAAGGGAGTPQPDRHSEQSLKKWYFLNLNVHCSPQAQERARCATAGGGQAY
jgi:hypothetical protein